MLLLGESRSTIPDSPSIVVTPPVIGARPLSIHAMIVTSPVAAGLNSASMTFGLVIDHVSGISRLSFWSLNSTTRLLELRLWLMEVVVTPENDHVKHAKPSLRASELLDELAAAPQLISPPLMIVISLVHSTAFHF